MIASSALRSLWVKLVAPCAFLGPAGAIVDFLGRGGGRSLPGLQPRRSTWACVRLNWIVSYGAVQYDWDWFGAGLKGDGIAGEGIGRVLVRAR
jgi:hypothetical protein